MIRVENLVKSYKDVKAVQNLSFNVKEGEFFAFLGINGAGKSTTINIICSELKKDSGKVFVDGMDIDKDIYNIKKEIGVVFQNSLLDKVLTVKDNLEVRASLYGITGKRFKLRLSELAKLLDFENLLNKSVGKLSGGQKRRIDIARALMHNPKILILDEPTTGLDPKTRQNIWQVLNKLRKDDKITIFLTTHYMEESVDCDHIVIIDEGKKIAEGSPLELKNKYTKDYITLYNAKLEDVEKLNLKYSKIKDAYKLEIESTYEATKLILQYPTVFSDYEITKGGMDDVFLNATGKMLEGVSYENT